MIVKHPRTIIEQHGTIKNYRYDRDVSGSRRKSIPAAAEYKTTKSNLDTITEGFIILIGASPMMSE